MFVTVVTFWLQMMECCCWSIDIIVQRIYLVMENTKCLLPVTIHHVN